MVQILTLRGLHVASFLDFDDQNPYLSRARISTKTARYADLEIRPNFQ